MRNDTKLDDKRGLTVLVDSIRGRGLHPGISIPKSRVAKGFESVASLVAGKIPEGSSKSGLFGRK